MVMAEVCKDRLKSKKPGNVNYLFGVFVANALIFVSQSDLNL